MLASPYRFYALREVIRIQEVKGRRQEKGMEGLGAEKGSDGRVGAPNQTFPRVPRYRITQPAVCTRCSRILMPRWACRRIVSYIRIKRLSYRNLDIA